MKLLGVTGLEMSSSVSWVYFDRVEVKIEKKYSYQDMLKIALPYKHWSYHFTPTH